MSGRLPACISNDFQPKTRVYKDKNTKKNKKDKKLSHLKKVSFAVSTKGSTLILSRTARRLQSVKT